MNKRVHGGIPGGCMNARIVSKGYPREVCSPITKVLLNELNDHVMYGTVKALALAVALRVVTGSA